MTCNIATEKNDVINGNVVNTMRRELRINVTNWEDQLFWMTQPAAVPSCYYSCFFGWCLLKCKQPPHIQNFMLSYTRNYGKVMHLFLTSGSENHVFPQRIILFLHILCAVKLAFFRYDISDMFYIFSIETRRLFDFS